MEDQLKQKDPATKESDRPVQLVLDTSGNEGDTLNLGHVIYHMREKRRVFLWVMVLCLVAGLCLPLLLYQVTKPQTTVSSVVTLRYEAPVKVERVTRDGGTEWVLPDHPEYEQVSDLSAPDGTDLDLNQITSSYVLQTALDEMPLSQPITASSLRANITIQPVLTEESQRTKESLSGLAGLRNANAYQDLLKAEMRYENRFVVSLSNGFTEEGSENSLFKTELKDEELAQLLDRVLTLYNDYLVQTYADIRLPEDQFSVIDVESLDVMDALDAVREGLQTLETYGSSKTETVQEYRSWQTGRSLKDWTETVSSFRTAYADYLYATVLEKGIARDRNATLNTARHLMRTNRQNLQRVNESIEKTQGLLENYQNDSIYVSMQESEGTRAVTSATDYYNQMIRRQMENYQNAATLTRSAKEYEDRVSRLEAGRGTEVTDGIREELAQVVSGARLLYSEIRAHMEELFQTPLFTMYEQHSMPQGQSVNFLVASWKRMALGAVAGLVIAFGLWFLSGMMTEIIRVRQIPGGGKEKEEIGR